MTSTAQFVGEPLKAVGATLDAARMAAGGPGLPQRFTWRGRDIRIVEVRRAWRETGPCHHGSGERYVRKHWYEVATASDGVMTIYFQRQPRGGRKTARWWLFTIAGE